MTRANGKPVGLLYSGGASSRWMIDAVLNGEIERPDDIAVFQADTGDEHVWTYEDIERTKERCADAGIPYFECADPNETLPEHILTATTGARTRADTPPFWTENPGGGRGQLRQKCTMRFKTSAIRRAQSAWLKSIGKKKRIETWIGFGADEMHRANKAVARADVQWSTLAFPAIKLGRTRAAQRADIARLGLTAPKFSMCIKCPYKDRQRWLQTSAEDLPAAFEMDEKIRHGLEHVGVHEPCFLSDRLIPVEQLIRRGDPQQTLPGFEPPGCDAGMCFL